MIAAIKDLLSVSSRVGSEFTECRMQPALWSHILYTVCCEVWYAMGYALLRQVRAKAIRTSVRRCLGLRFRKFGSAEARKSGRTMIYVTETENSP